MLFDYGFEDMRLSALEKPKGTTHAKIVCNDGRASMVAIKDFDCFQGVSGKVIFLKENRKGKYTELGEMDFDGTWPIKPLDPNN